MWSYPRRKNANKTWTTEKSVFQSTDKTRRIDNDTSLGNYFSFGFIHFSFFYLLFLPSNYVFLYRHVFIGPSIFSEQRWHSIWSGVIVVPVISGSWIAEVGKCWDFFFPYEGRRNKLNWYVTIQKCLNLTLWIIYLSDIIY